MSTVAIILIVAGAVLLIMFAGGFVIARRRAASTDVRRNIERADRALEQARAQDRGWDRSALELACQSALRSERPDFAYDTIDLVLVDDRPGVVEDRAHLVARGDEGHARLILGRREGGD